MLQARKDPSKQRMTYSAGLLAFKYETVEVFVLKDSVMKEGLSAALVLA